jgi:urea carboxylase
VGIGGAYLCVYGMEGPGGYQFTGRTIQMWNRWRSTEDFPVGKPWLLRCFDQLQFYPVTADELMDLRESFPSGRFKLRIEETTFRLSDYLAFLNDIADEATLAKSRQVHAFEAERERWRMAGLDKIADDATEATADTQSTCPAGMVAVAAPLTASVWQMLVEPGQTVSEGEKIAVLEAMKMEITINAPAAGTVVEIFVTPGRMVEPGQTLLWMK